MEKAALSIAGWKQIFSACVQHVVQYTDESFPAFALFSLFPSLLPPFIYSLLHHGCPATVLDPMAAAEMFLCVPSWRLQKHGGNAAMRLNCCVILSY